MQKRLEWSLPLLLLLFALAFLYRSPYNASALETVPDSVEYAVGAQRLAQFGHDTIRIDGIDYPPRYAPWFSALLLMPIYRLFPHEIGAGILGVLALSLLGIFAAYRIGKRFGGVWAGTASALCLLLFKEYRSVSRLVLTDAPSTALVLIGCALYLRMRSGVRRGDYLLAGLLSGLAFAFRVDMIGLCLPFGLMALVSKEKRLPRLAALLLPIALVEIATLIYNQQAFGDWRRNGYHFWCAVPYDYPWLVWSLHYLKANLIPLAAKQCLLILALGGVGITLLWRRKDPLLQPALIYLGLAAGPSSLAHLFYFSQGVRFYLPALALLAVLGGAGLATLIPDALRRREWLLPCLAACSLLLTPRIHHAFAVVPMRRIVADRLARSTPSNAVIVTGIEPVYLEPLVLRGTQRMVVPVSRGVEYASKVVTRRRIADPKPPPVLGSPRSPAMFAGGAKDVVPFTADEAPEKLLDLARAGRPVYADLSFTPSSYPDAKTRSLFQFIPVSDIPIPAAGHLFRMEPIHNR